MKSLVGAPPRLTMVLAVALASCVVVAVWLAFGRSSSPILIDNQSGQAYLAQVGIADGDAIYWRTFSVPAGSRKTVESANAIAIDILTVTCSPIASHDIGAETRGGRIVIKAGPIVERSLGGDSAGYGATRVSDCPRS